MSAHPDLRPLIDGGEPERGSRGQLLAHLRDCAACRASLAAQDPSLLFTLLGCEPVPAEVLQRVSERTAAAIAAERGPRPVRGWAWGALAASLLLAGLFAAYLSRPLVDPSAAQPRLAAAPRSAPELYVIPAGMIEVLDSPGEADVVEMTVGDVEVVMIFDEAMGI